MRIQINKTHFPVTTLGPGRRIGIWFQGCTIGCVGCVSLDTWEATRGTTTNVAALLDWSLTVAPAGFDGVTISGGEPFQQPQALGALLEGFAAMRGTTPAFDLLCYSGYPLKKLRRRFGLLLQKLDAVVSGPFVANQAPGRYLRGSSNQELVPLSVLGHKRYGSNERSEQASSARPSVQVNVDEQGVWYIGIPRPGDLERMEAAARERGVEMKGASWCA